MKNSIKRVLVLVLVCMMSVVAIGNAASISGTVFIYDFTDAGADYAFCSAGASDYGTVVARITVSYANASGSSFTKNKATTNENSRGAVSPTVTVGDGCHGIKATGKYTLTYSGGTISSSNYKNFTKGN